jgi:hypothetical protein
MITMATTTIPVLQDFDVSELEMISRQVLRCDSLQIEDWQVNQLGGGAGNPVSVGLYRFEMSGQVENAQLSWSVILKIIQSPANTGWQNMGEGEEETHWNYWRRELLIYQSGLLETLPEGLAAPRCFGVEDRPGDIAWLWLEDIRDSLDGSWTLERYALTARHLGRLNGLFTTGQFVPEMPWLSQQRNRQWVNHMADWHSFPWDHPRLLERQPAPIDNPFRAMVLDSERFLARLESLPVSLCHGDTYPTNFMARQPSDGNQQTVAFDWALAGIQPLGDDLGQFVYGAQMNLANASPDEVSDCLFENYLEGLRESGCQVDAQLIRFGFVAAAALRVGLFQLILLQEDLKKDGKNQSAGQSAKALPDCFEVRMAREAYQMLEAM